jgi:predicted nucleotidyltransferase
LGRGKLKEPYQGLLEELVKALHERLGEDLVSVVVYGSVARGEAGRDSDIDILVVARSLPKSMFARQDLFMDVEGKIRGEVEKLEQQGYFIDFSPVLLTPEEAQRTRPLYLDMVEDAIILYDKDSFFANVLARLRARLKELGAERVRRGKLWYWVLKKDYKWGEVIEI